MIPLLECCCFASHGNAYTYRLYRKPVLGHSLINHIELSDMEKNSKIAQWKEPPAVRYSPRIRLFALVGFPVGITAVTGAQHAQMVMGSNLTICKVSPLLIDGCSLAP